MNRAPTRYSPIRTFRIMQDGRRSLVTSTRLADRCPGPYLGARGTFATDCYAGPTAQTPMSPEIIRAGGISVDLDRCSARAGRRVLRLTLTEYNLLVCLLQNPGRTMTRRQLLDAAWEENYRGSERTVDTHVGRLRKKLGKTGQRIQTLRGTGYRLDAIRRRSS